MILYSSNITGFTEAVDNNTIVDSIEEAFVRNLGKRPSTGERRAWNNSLRFMETAVRKSGAPQDCGILIEYTIPATSKRVDFIITGQDENGQDNFVIVELKQWDHAEATDKEAIVRAFVGQRQREMPHPSYQANSYRELIRDTNEAVQTGNIGSAACSYMHNFPNAVSNPLTMPQYTQIIDQAPIFFKEDSEHLQGFIRRFVGKGKGMDILYRIESGKIKPSKMLIEHISSMFDGNTVYTLIDEQKVALSTIVKAAENTAKRKTIIVNGGPGTGKSVISMNALTLFLHQEKNVKFVAPNAAFRSAMVEGLTAGRKGKGRVYALFSGSGGFYNVAEETYDVLIVDEAHRLKGRGAYMYQGVNQVEDIIRASTVNIFFVDDKQRVRPEDIGSVKEIKRAASMFNSTVEEVKLTAQFRCSGAEGYINWLDSVFQLGETGNFTGWDKQAFEFKIVDSPHDLLTEIKKKNQENCNNRSRMLAGFAWKWTAENAGNPNGEVPDVVISEYDFSMPWNSRTSREKWAYSPEGVNQIGCIHTSQGLEFDYVGVIIGNDLKYDPERKAIYADYDEYHDSQGRKGLRNSPEILTELVSNVYVTLLSRGMKGCYVFCRDPHLKIHLLERLTYAEQN